MSDQTVSNLTASDEIVEGDTGLAPAVTEDFHDAPVKVALAPEDLPTDPAQIETEAEAFFADSEAEINTMIVLSYVDPLEMQDGSPRFTEVQRKLIIDATEIVDGWRS